MKSFAFSRSGENPYVIRLRQGECTPKRKKGKKIHKRIQILFFQTLSAKTAPQPNLVSDVHRAAPLFRENTGISRSWSRIPHFWRSGSETSWAHLSIPTSLLIAPYSNTSLYPDLLIPVLLYRDVLHSARIFPEEEAAAALGRCEYCLSHPLLSPLEAHTQAQSDILAH